MNIRGKYDPAPKKTPKALLYVIGLALFLVAGAAAFFLSEPLMNLAARNIPQINSIVAAAVNNDANNNELLLRAAFGGGIFLIIVLIAGTLFAAFQPKMPKGVSEMDLDREKRDKLKEEAAAKRRKKEMQAKMRQRNAERK